MAWNSSKVAWWCLKACISVKLSCTTIVARRLMSASGSSRVGVLLGQVHGVFHLGHRAHLPEVGDFRPVGRRLSIDALLERIQQGGLGATGQRRDGLRIRLGRWLHAVLRRAHLGTGVPRQQRQQLVAQAHTWELQEIPAQVPPVCRCTSIGLPVSDRMNRPAAPIDSASPVPWSDRPSARAFASILGISG